MDLYLAHRLQEVFGGFWNVLAVQVRDEGSRHHAHFMGWVVVWASVWDGTPLLTGCCLGSVLLCIIWGTLKSRDITLPTKVRLVKAMVYQVFMYECESWTIKKAEHQRIDAFELWCWKRLLRVPWTTRRSNQSILKEISPELSLEGLMLRLKLQYLAMWCEELTHLKRPWCWERLMAGGEGDDRGCDGWKASPTQWTWVWVTPGVGDGDRQGTLCASFHGLKRVEHDGATELSWTDWRRLLRVPWTARRSKQSILKEINHEYSLEGLMLKLQYLGHLMQRADSLEKILMPGKTEAGEGDDRGWDGWMVCQTQLMWVWASSGRWWRTEKPGVCSSGGCKQSDMTEQQLLIMGDKQILCVSLYDVIGRTKHQLYAKELNQNLSRTLTTSLQKT